jgi:hypothetical protein
VLQQCLLLVWTPFAFPRVNHPALSGVCMLTRPLYGTSQIMESHDVIFSDMWGALQSDEFIRIIETLSRIKGLEKDPYLHGGGLHFHPPGSRLEMHLDYSIHPISKKERRLNLIIYMNRWQRQRAQGVRGRERGL